MELRTYTGLWRVEKRLYKFYDINLPYPVSVRQIGIFAAVAIPWLTLMAMLKVPFAPPFGHILWLAPPFVITWMANKPVAEGKTLVEYLFAQISYVTNPKSYAALAPVPRKSHPRHLRGVAWSARSASEGPQAEGR